jgi:hypothetical protein
MTNEEYVKRLQELSDEYNKTKPAQSACPSCGHCPHCGRGGYMQPYYVPMPYYQPYTPYWQPTWITTVPTVVSGGYPGNSNTTHFIGEHITYTSQQ